MNVSEMVRSFGELAKKHGECLNKGASRKADKYMHKMIILYNELKKNDGVGALEPLMSSEDPYERFRAAMYILQEENCRKKAEQVLKELVEDKGGIYSLSAKVALTRWKKGEADWF